MLPAVADSADGVLLSPVCHLLLRLIFERAPAAGNGFAVWSGVRHATPQNDAVVHPA